MKTSISLVIFTVAGFLLGSLTTNTTSSKNLAPQDNEQLSRDDKTFLRTIEFLSQRLPPDSNPLTLDEEQQSKIQELIEYAKSINDGSQDEELLAQLRKRYEEKGLPPASYEHNLKKWLPAYKRSKIEKKFLSMADDILGFQKREPLLWHPGRRGMFKCLTETPFGDAAGLDDHDKEQIRKKANELGNRIYREYVDVRLEAEELLLEHVDKQFIADLNHVFYPTIVDSDYEVAKDTLDPSWLMYRLTYEYDPQAKEKLNDSKF